MCACVTSVQLFAAHVVVLSDIGQCHVCDLLATACMWPVVLLAVQGQPAAAQVLLAPGALDWQHPAQELRLLPTRAELVLVEVLLLLRS